MERKIGEEFEFIGYILMVSERTCGCKGCFFYEHNLACHHREILDITGSCFVDGWSGLMFKEVKLK